MGLPPPSCPPCIRNTLSIPASRASRQCFQRSSAKNPGCSLLSAWYLDPELHMAISGTFFKPCGSSVASRCSRTCAIHGGYHEYLASHVQPNPDAVQSLRYDRETHPHSRPSRTRPRPCAIRPPPGHSAASGDSMARASSWAVPNTSSAVWRHAAASKF